VPPSNNVDISYNYRNASGDVYQGSENIRGLDWGYRLGVEGIFSLGKTTGLGAPLVSLGLFSAQQGGNPGPSTRAFPGPVALGAMGGTIGVGWGIRAGKMWTIEALAWYGYAEAHVTDELYSLSSADSTEEIDGIGHYTEKGVRLEGVFTPAGDGFQMAFGVGWRRMEAEAVIKDPPYTYLNDELATGSADYSFTGAGFYPFVQLGVRF